MKVTYVTGNAHKAKYFSDMVGIDIPNASVDVDELQSLDIRKVVKHKAEEAYRQIGSPILVEDTQLTFHALGRLPGTYIKWFLEELDVDGLCRLLNAYDDRSATAGAVLAYYDGENMKFFERNLKGKIAKVPAGESGFGWNRIFIPNGADMTLGQMSDTEFRQWYARVKPFAEVGNFLRS